MTMNTESALAEYALDALEAADMALAHAEGLKIEAPHTAADVTSEWLGELIGAGVPGAKLDRPAPLETDMERCRACCGPAAVGIRQGNAARPLPA